MTNLFRQAKEILNRLEEAGYESYIVGGAVRDFLLNNAIHDFDITTSAPIAAIKRLFPKTIDVAVKHGTVVIFHEGASFEVTSFRGNSLLEDLRLRDFTMNAMAINSKGIIYDPYCGEADIKSKTIRGVEEPQSRFEEDPLRMLRAIRFVSQLSFTIEEETAMAILTCGDHINKVAIERITVELEKIWLGKFVEKAFEQFQDTKLLAKIDHLRPLQAALQSQKIITMVKKVASITEVWTLLLFMSNHKEATDYLHLMKQSKKIITEVNLILSRLTSVVECGFSLEDYYYLGLETTMKTERIRAALSNETANLRAVELAFSELPIKVKQELSLSGNDVMLYLNKAEPKTRIGELLTIAEKAVVTKKVANEKHAIISWLRKEGFIHAE
ncbi:MAG: CCA tRNA nucleotidyltransferase [Anaerobacillus sp.]|uniref:CCA tRNA nucleotidyltransferase n=1 Tax=Anaerobacillus sp. TaxID=1872506 RepID=UPI0039196ACB